MESKSTEHEVLCLSKWADKEKHMENFTRIALCQSKITFEDKATNLSQAHAYLEEAAKHSARILLFPEMSFIGFSMDTERTAERGTLLMDAMQSHAKNYNMYIGYGWAKWNEGRLSENHYSIIDPNGTLVSDYVKIHPFSFAGEHKKFQGGNHLSFFELDDFIASTFICYDLRFPQIFSVASQRASLIVVAANWPASRQEHWNCLVKARAIENQCYIGCVNCVGTQGSIAYAGGSAVINPNGEIICEAGSQEGIVYCDIQNDTEIYRSTMTILQDRRPSLYQSLHMLYTP